MFLVVREEEDEGVGVTLDVPECDWEYLLMLSTHKSSSGRTTFL